MAAVRGLIGIAFVLEPAIQASFQQQALQKRSIRFPVLDRQAAHRVNRFVLQLPAPFRLQQRLVAIIPQQLIDDLDDAPVLKDVGISAATLVTMVKRAHLPGLAFLSLRF